jgi:sterol desaturase/sphingolipid hydroxylase (fatty acid hydroxylase superfamily)
MSLTLPTILTIVASIIFLTLERIFPGRKLPSSRGWYFRAILINLCQLAITLATNTLWVNLFGTFSFFHLSYFPPYIQGFIVWFIGTFVFYWWHRARHMKGLWQIFHQVHHSPSRIEVVTSFYKHPIEIFSDSLLSGILLYPILGASLQGAFWFNFFAATGEYFYHANIKTPHWLKYIIQTPELHSIHHELNVHHFNYSDLPLWDKLFGTYKDTNTFTKHCGFPKNNERKLLKMLFFKDVYKE